MLNNLFCLFFPLILMAILIKLSRLHPTRKAKRIYFGENEVTRRSYVILDRPKSGAKELDCSTVVFLSAWPAAVTRVGSAGQLHGLSALGKKKWLLRATA
jgi:hypothetical protein